MALTEKPSVRRVNGARTEIVDGDSLGDGGYSVISTEIDDHAVGVEGLWSNARISLAAVPCSVYHVTQRLDLFPLGDWVQV